MDPRTESIKQEVEETLEDMAAKMEQIEERVVGTAREKVEMVKEKLDIRHFVVERPWTMLGVSVAAGFAVGSIRRSSKRDEDWDGGRALGAGSFGGRSRAFQYEHSDDPYENVDEEFGPSLFQGGGEPVRQALFEEPTRRGGELQGERMGGYRGQSMSHAPERPHRSRQLVQRSISQVKQRAPGILAALRENFGDEIEALKRAVVVAAGNSLRGILQSKLPQIAEEFDRVRGNAGQHGVESGWSGEQRQQTWQGQGPAGQGSQGYQGRGNQGYQSQGNQGYQGRGNQGYQSSEGRYGAEGRGGSEGRYGGEARQGGEARYGSGESRQGSEGRQGAEGRGGSQGPSMSSSAESEGGTRNRGNEPFGPEGGQGPTGRKSHN